MAEEKTIPTSITKSHSADGLPVVQPNLLTQAMAGANPRVTAQALEALLKQLLGTTPVAETVITYPNNETKVTITGYKPTPRNVSDPQLSQALILARQSLTPMAEPEIAALLTQLRSISLTRKEETTDVALQITTMARMLTQYPADVVRYVLTTWHQRSKFFPTMNELLEPLNLWSRSRRVLAAAFKIDIADRAPTAS